MQDPVTATPAVLVKQYNITQHKELEAQLSLRHGDLQRCARHVGLTCVSPQAVHIISRLCAKMLSCHCLNSHSSPDLLLVAGCSVALTML